MNFNLKKCKVVSIKHRPSPLTMLPFVAYYYYLGENILEYADSEKDLGVLINTAFKFNDHQEKLLSLANQKFGMLKRTCHFINNSMRGRTLYLSLVRSQFEHCSPVWRPNCETSINKFENFQKKCIKWILCEENSSYTRTVYLKKCQNVNILPIEYRFNVADMTLFHKIVYNLIPISIPMYLRRFESSRLRSTHLDSLSFEVNISTEPINYHNLKKSFFFRSHTIWNSLPFEIRNIQDPLKFKTELHKYYWNKVKTEIGESGEDRSFDDGG